MVCVLGDKGLGGRSGSTHGTVESTVDEPRGTVDEPRGTVDEPRGTVDEPRGTVESTGDESSDDMKR